jgi:hypothetical protein
MAKAAARSSKFAQSSHQFHPGRGNAAVVDAQADSWNNLGRARAGCLAVFYSLAVSCWKNGDIAEVRQATKIDFQHGRGSPVGKRLTVST